MSSNGKRNRRREYMNGKTCAPVDSDGDARYSQESLIKMNDRFVERVERAFESGSERRQSACGANASRLR